MSLLEVNGLNSYYGDSHILFDVSLGSSATKWWRCSAATAPARARR